MPRGGATREDAASEVQSRRSRPQPRTSLYPAGSDATLVHVASKPSALACPIARQPIDEPDACEHARLFINGETGRRGDERTRTADILNASDPRQRRAHRDRLASVAVSPASTAVTLNGSPRKWSGRSRKAPRRVQPFTEISTAPRREASKRGSLEVVRSLSREPEHLASTESIKCDGEDEPGGRSSAVAEFIAVNAEIERAKQTAREFGVPPVSWSRATGFCSAETSRGRAVGHTGQCL